MFPCVPPSAEVGKVGIFKVDGHDLILVNAILYQSILEEVEKRRLAAPANAGDNFNHIFVSPLSKPIRKEGAAYFCVIHINSSFGGEIFVDIIAKYGEAVNGRYCVYENS